MMVFPKHYWKRSLVVYLLVAAFFIGGAGIASRSVETLSMAAEAADRTRIILDPGHGGEDGGASSCTGIPESTINLAISLRLRDLLEFLGCEVHLTRSEDRALYDSGSTIAEKKASDLRQRVRLVNETENALLVSIHQNHFPEDQYSGAQIFYSPTEYSAELASWLQCLFVSTLNPGSRREAKPADSVYLMQKINCTGVLVECGFLSNPREEALLRTEDYQKKVSCVLACGIVNWISGKGVAFLG